MENKSTHHTSTLFAACLQKEPDSLNDFPHLFLESMKKTASDKTFQRTFMSRLYKRAEFITTNIFCLKLTSEGTMHILPILCVFLVLNLVEAMENDEPVFHRFEYEFKVLEKLVDYGRSITLFNTQLQELKQNIEDLKSHTISTNQMEQKIKEFKADSDISTTYIRWGRSSCPDSATIVYDGFATGSHYTHSGGAANYICLHRNPKWDDHTENPSSSSLLYGAEYETANSVLKHLHNHDVPCAVCQIPRSSNLMVPGRNDCSQNYTMEYSGYLMSGHHSHASATEFVCVDKEAEATTCSSQNDKDGKLFYFVHAVCGSLKCPPYEQGKEVTCAVCSYSPRK